MGWRNKYEQGTIPKIKGEMDTQLNITPKLDILNILIDKLEKSNFKKCCGDTLLAWVPCKPEPEAKVMAHTEACSPRAAIMTRGKGQTSDRV